jgi:hypothetical protein
MMMRNPRRHSRRQLQTLQAPLQRPPPRRAVMMKKKHHGCARGGNRIPEGRLYSGRRRGRRHSTRRAGEGIRNDVVDTSHVANI